MTHDPMCPLPALGGLPVIEARCFVCVALSSARAEERERAAERVAAALRSLDCDCDSCVIAAARGSSDGEATPQASTWGMRPDESPGEWLARVESPESKAAWEKFCDDYEASKRRANRGAAIDGEATP